ncbi:TPM domain-containing protein [Myceligenerans salitolerans]|uniref:TPM domain-containing protein n=1 Tax=Myceligenerans salitolerans TaxID=1230528 RepID=A0ABS3ID27_9MICO|nr:TPM domain-containing protein [Myceligenerans salitolerans]MBO0610939.1 TPM domain-containing protein [Myceligenerans salitolerans]
MTQTLAPHDHPAPDARAGTTSSRRTVLAGVIAGGVLVGLFGTAFAIGGTTLSDHAEAGVVGADHDPPAGAEPSPTGTELLSAKVQAATMQDILPSAMPIVVDVPVTDEAGVLSPEEYERVSQAVAAVEAETSLRLFVVYLETFDGIPPEDWADATATKSGLTPEELLLAIATTDHVQGLSVDVNGPVSTRDHASIVAASQTAVAEGDWAAAATGAAEAAVDTRDPGGWSWWTVVALLAVVAVGAALAAGWWYLRHRGPRAEADTPEDDVPYAADDDGAPSAGDGDATSTPAGTPVRTPADAGRLRDAPTVPTMPGSADDRATAAPSPADDGSEPDHAVVRTPAIAGVTPVRAGTMTAAAPAAPAPALAPLSPTRPTTGSVSGPLPTTMTATAAAPVVAPAPAPDGSPRSHPEDDDASGAHRPGPAGGRPDGPSGALPDDLSDGELAARADDALVTLDDALRTSAQELELARAESSGGGLHDLEVVLADATERTREAFALRAELLSADEGPSRDLAHQVLALCSEASASLDSGTAALEDVRRLKSRANRLLDASWQRAGELDRKIEQAREALSALAGEFPGDAIKPVTGNAELAEHLVADARRAIDTGRAASAKRDRAFAAAAARSAQNALAHAERLLDEVHATHADLTEALPRLDKAVASLTQDVGDTERVAGGDPQAAMARTTARAALKQVEVTRETADPFALLARVAAAESALDRALARHRDASEVDARKAALVRDTLSRLDVRLRQVDTLVTTRRGAVGPDARMRHSEAARLTAASRDARARGDRAAALDLAQRADTQAFQALTAALRDAAADGAPRGMPLAGINLTLEGRRGHGGGTGAKAGLLGLLTRSPRHVRTGGIGGGFGGGGFGSGRAD